jgi:F-type H+-transporting ATPase subunit delta
MSLAKIASRYAKSLIDLAQEQNNLDRVYQDIQALASACANRDFELLCKSPIVSASKKLQVFRTLFESAFDPASFSFFSILVRKGREFYLPEIVQEFIKQYEAIRKKTRVKLTTAEALSNETLQEIKTKLAQSSSTRDQIEIDTKIAPELIGGFILEYDDKLYDASVSNQLRLARKTLFTNQ